MNTQGVTLDSQVGYERVQLPSHVRQRRARRR